MSTWSSSKQFLPRFSKLTYFIEWKSTKMSIAVHATNQTLINFRQTIELRGNNQSEDSINKDDKFEID